jgi:hypothetical protein
LPFQAKTERSFTLDSENTVLILGRYCISLELMQKSRKRRRYAMCHARSRRSKHGNPDRPPTHICLSCHVHPSTNYVTTKADHPNAMHPIYLSMLKLGNFHPHRIHKAIMVNKRKKKPQPIAYKPESICSTTFSPVQAAHSRQVCATVEGNLIFWISSGYEIVLTYKPPDMCQATWQWKAKTSC